ncbi:MAG: cell division protein ZapA [Treponema sp.]|nr:cell division protein ZapA [Treponema sp.]
MAVEGGAEAFPESGSGPHDLFINILGASFSITASEDPGYLNEVLEQYHSAVANTQDISGMKDPLKVAILTGFLLCDEINKLRLQFDKDQAAAEKALDRAKSMILHLDKAIERAHLADRPPPPQNG